MSPGPFEMNLPLAFLHGEQVLVALGLAALIALIGVPAVLYVWLWHTKVSEFKLVLAYLLLMAILAVVFSSNNDPTAMFSLTLSGLGFILSLPWSVLAGWVLSKAFNSDVSDGAVAILMMVGACINAVLLYFAAVKMRRLTQ